MSSTIKKLSVFLLVVCVAHLLLSVGVTEQSEDVHEDSLNEAKENNLLSHVNIYFQLISFF
jgi:hypothetical protein